MHFPQGLPPDERRQSPGSMHRVQQRLR